MSEKQINILEKFAEVHEDIYDYSLVDYKTTKEKVTIICKIHGEFRQTPEKHIQRKQGCPECGKIKSKLNQRFSKETIIQKFIKVHGDRYDYSLVDYKGIHKKVQIICKEHGVFTQSPNSHAKGNNCKLCSKKDARDTLDSFLEKLPNYIKNNYDFSNIKYIDSITAVDVVCKNHGTFKIIPRSLIRGHGCKKCATITSSSKNRLKCEDILNRANKVHNNKYTYSLLADYKSNKDMLNIKCPVHGYFKQAVVSHLRGQGCPACAKELTISKLEKNLGVFIESLGYKILKNYRPFWLNGLELDIYIPSIKVAIEYNGAAYHHSSFNTLVEFYNNSAKSEYYHKNKYEICKENQIDLIHIFDFEDLELWKENLKFYFENKDDCIITYEHTARYFSPRKDINLIVYGGTKIIKSTDIKLNGDLLE